MLLVVGRRTSTWSFHFSSLIQADWSYQILFLLCLTRIFLDQLSHWFQMLPKKHTKFKFDDKLFTQGKRFNPKITRPQKNQIQLEYTKEKLRQKAGLSMSIAHFLTYRRVLQESARSLKKFKKRSGKGSCFSIMVCGTISGHLSHIVDT